MIIEDCR